MVAFLQESSLLQAASPFYKTFAIECSRTQVSVDMFLFSAAYQDVATLGQALCQFELLLLCFNYFSIACLPHYTSGQTYYYPAFNAGRSEDALKFAHEFGQVIAQPIMLEAVMRVRASRGPFAVSVVSFPLSTFLVSIRTAYGILPRQLLRPFNGSVGHARCSSRPILCY